jgi:hypothetical protein
MPNEITPAPTLKRLLIAKFGAWRLPCRHDFRIVQAKTHLYLQCMKCDRRTEGFEIAGDAKN